MTVLHPGMLESDETWMGFQEKHEHISKQVLLVHLGGVSKVTETNTLQSDKLGTILNAKPALERNGLKREPDRRDSLKAVFGS